MMSCKKRRQIHPMEDDREYSLDSQQDVNKSAEKNQTSPSAVASNNHSVFISKLFMFRVTVFVSLFITACLCGTLSYFIINFYENERFVEQFHSDSTQFGDLIERGLMRVVETNAQTAVYIGLLHKDVSKWPLVLTPKFDETYRQIEQISHIAGMGIAPIFNASLTTEFENSFNDAMKNLTGVSPNLTVHTNLGGSSTTRTTSMIAPIINQEPHQHMLLLDMYNDLNFEGHIDSIIDCVQNDRKASFKHTERCVSLSNIIPQTGMPHVLVMSPIYPHNALNEVYGIINTGVILVPFLQKLSPDYISGIDVVIHSVPMDGSDENTGIFYTISIVDGQVSFKCDEGDCHDSTYSHMKIQRMLQIPHVADISNCVRIDIYPNDDFYETYHTNAPWVMSFWSVVMVLFASVVFLVYDHFVQIESTAKEHIMETRRRLVRFASHEIRTPLNTVMLGLELLHHLFLNANDSRDDDSGDSGDVGEVKPDDSGKSGAGNSSPNMSKTALAKQQRATERQEDLDVLTDIESSTSAAVMVLNDLLDYDAIEMNMMDIHLTPINALEFMKNAIRQFHIQAKQEGVCIMSNLNMAWTKAEDDIRVKSAQHASATVVEEFHDIHGQRSISELSVCNELVPLESLCFMADRHRLIQVFRNLISNALKFTPHGGLVTITASWKETPCAEAHIDDQCASVLFSVLDTGPGISKCNQRLLFGEGVQFDANRLQEGRGSGLGLFIAKKIAAAHSGRIWATSEGEGMGSCFYIELPVVKLTPEQIASSTSADITEESLPQLGRLGSKGSVISSRSSNDLIVMIRTKRILVVDDVPSNHKMACRVLEVNGFIADHATSGQDCLDIMKREGNLQGYDCILMDFMMPDMNGPEVTVALREMGYVNPVIGLTANLMMDDITHFMESGANLVMPKPFNFKDFKSMLIYQSEDI